MEHAALHALQLIGLILALGGPLLVLILLRPAARAHPVDAGFLQQLTSCHAEWVVRGALVAAAAVVLDLFVLTAEVEGRTVFGGVDPQLVFVFVTQTTVGRLALARVGFLVLGAAVMRWATPARWWLAMLCCFGALVCAGLVSHAAAQPVGRGTAITTQIAHLTAAAAWMGVLMHLLAARRVIESAHTRAEIALLSDIVRRFSPLALSAATLLAASGVYAVLRYFTTPADVLASAYGLTLVVKLILMAPLLAAAFINFRRIRPALLALGTVGPPHARTPARPHVQVQPSTLLQRFGRTLELEVTAGVLVITVAGIVGSISPPGADGAQRLTATQIRAMQHPVLPPATLIAPSTFVGAATRTVDDLRYSELMHRWSGVFVIVMGVLWLGQSIGGGIRALAGRLWPFLLLPFAVFISIFADADVFLVPRLSFWEVISNPAILEHQLGALIIVVLAWLGWRDRLRPAAERPMGWALPIIMILGSLLLLGHAHSAFSATEELTNLINVQHAVLGAFGLLAGTIRWLSLRELIPLRWGNLAWPVLIILLGCFMAFCYREVV
jgi:putative copper resistance protein D